MANVIQVLRETQLLGGAQLGELGGPLQAGFPDTRSLLDELVRRNWLTGYQAEILARGRGHELRLGPFLLLEPLGAGGMGEVFRARNQLMDRVVALKRILPHRLQSDAAAERFFREVRAASKLSHPGIVQVLHADQGEDTCFLVMELVEGTDMARWLEHHGPLDIAEACEVARQAALGLQHAHEQGLVHRDVKPSNLMRTADGNTVKLLDLGLALLASATTLTGSGASLMGTADYIAPEQVRDPHRADIRADIYSLGCTLYHFLTGRPPFADAHPAARAYLHQAEEPPAVEGLRSLPRGLAEVVRRMMAKRPEDRYATPAAAAEALAPFTRANRAPRGGDTLGGWQLGDLVLDTGRCRYFDARQGAECAVVQVLNPAVAGDARVVQRFGDDLAKLVGLSHPGLAEVRAVGRDEAWDWPFAVLAPFSGRSLAAELEHQGALSVERGRDLFVPLAEAVGAAHSRGVVHGNLQPAGVLLRSDGSATVLDFGLAAAAGRPLRGAADRSVSLVRLFAAPEQIRKGQTDSRSDVYALAGMLYHALAYADPAAREPDAFDPRHVPEELRELLARALERGPERRPADGNALVAALGATGGPRPLHLEASGRWLARPADNPAASWGEAAPTPATVRFAAGRVYQWKLDRSAGDAQLAPLPRAGGLQALVRLELRGSRVTDAGLAFLAGLTGLRELDLGITAVTDAGLRSLASLTTLCQLDLSRTSVRGEGLCELRSLHSLADIDLTRCPHLTDAALACLGELAGLRSLRLGETAITDVGLAHLGRLTGLARLHLGWCRGVTDAGMTHLRRLTGLVALDLSNTGVGDAGTEGLAELAGLEVLDLGGTAVSDRGVARLGRLGRLRELNLGNTPIGDAALAALPALSCLRHLELWRCPAITPAAVAALRKQMPGCTISG